MNELNKAEKASLWYEEKTWLRSIVQLIPSVGGSVDLLFSQRATEINSKRVIELIQNVSDKLASFDESKLNKDFLETEDFFDIFRRCAEITTRTTSNKKRKFVADYLSGLIQSATIDDISGQILEDINALQGFHLQVLAVLPENIYEPVPIREKVTGMSGYILDKAVSDLNRFGFVTMPIVDTAAVKTIHVTEYLIQFKKHFNLNE